MTETKRRFGGELSRVCGFLAAHLAGPCYAQMLGLLGKYGAENAEVSKFRIDLEEPVYDPEGRPRADFFTG